MDPAFFQLLVFGLVAALANVLGGSVLLPPGLHARYKPHLKYLLALGAGFMLAVTIFEILPKVILIWQSRFPDPADELFIPMTLLMAGYLLTQFFEHTVAPHFHLGEEMHSHLDEGHSHSGEHSHELISTKTAYTAVGGLLIHTFFDGVSIAAAAQVDTKIGLLVFVAVLLHKFPEGFTIGSMILAAGKDRRHVMIATSLIGGTTLLGVLGFYFIGTNFDGAVAYTLPVAAGVTLYVAASDLIPEVNHHGGHKPGVSLSVFAGVALFFGAHFILHGLLEH